MSAYMESLEIVDFKSFKGRHIIGPMKRFTAIIGPNGSGKSNLMDAISFVLGERGTSLRVRKLGDLIHGASVGRAVANKCKVQMNFVDEEGNRRTFSRAILSSTSSEYKVDGDGVTPAQYHQALQDINIFIKAHNFLVYQGAVEQIAMQSPKDLTTMIEELSKSADFKSDYERLKTEMQKAEVDAQENMNKRRDVANEKKEAKAEKDQARNYQAVRDDLAAKQRDFYLAQLYAAEQTRKKAQRQLENFQQEAEEVRQRKQEYDSEVSEKSRTLREKVRELSKLESKINKDEKKVQNQKPVCAQLKQVVLIGDGSHGTSQFYRARCEITKRLIEKHGFRIVGIEADWPDTYQLNKYVRGQQIQHGPFHDYTRFPEWMWRNEEVAEFVEWLRGRNASVPPEDHVGIYGLDLYSMGSSIQAVLDYLEKIDPETAKVARKRYGCLQPWVEDPAQYGIMSMNRGYAMCEKGVVRMLMDLMLKRIDYARQDEDAFFNAEMNARVIVDAEKYYRAMFYRNDESWNLRDTHMFETLKNLLNQQNNSKAVVWAHNSHVGDARNTGMGMQRDELNIGQLCREYLGDNVQIICCGTHKGKVAAAHNWDSEMKVMDVLPSLKDSHERVMYNTGLQRFMIDVRGKKLSPELEKVLSEPRLERFIGVVYRPQTERWSHYSQAILSKQMDCYVFFAETDAVRPFKKDHHLIHEAPATEDTYPTGL